MLDTPASTPKSYPNPLPRRLPLILSRRLLVAGPPHGRRYEPAPRARLSRTFDGVSLGWGERVRWLLFGRYASLCGFGPRMAARSLPLPLFPLSFYLSSRSIVMRLPRSTGRGYSMGLILGARGVILFVSSILWVLWALSIELNLCNQRGRRRSLVGLCRIGIARADVFIRPVDSPPFFSFQTLGRFRRKPSLLPALLIRSPLRP